jgi:fused signal recognition particle receptor
MFSFLRRKKKHAAEESVEQIQPLELPAEAEPEQTEKTPKTQPVESVETVTEKSLVNDAPQNRELQAETTPSEGTEHFNKEAVVAIEPILQTEAKEASDKEAPLKKQSFFTRLKKGLSKTRHSFTDSLATLVLGRKEIDDDLLEELEMILLTADVGVDATDRIISNLTEQVSRQELKDPQALITALKKQLQDILAPIALPLDINSHLAKQEGPFVILMVGINGVGKTTTIGKLAKKYQEEGKSVMLAAGDTFRAAAVEQLQTWGERNNVPVIAQKTGADSAAVLFDAIQSAKAKKIDILIADTAGRLHTQSNLMEELKKVTRVLAKIDATAPHEVMLVIDAGTGQNALNQAQQFKESVNASGITLTKLDGTAKGGIVFALAEQTQIPIRFIGIGESIDDLRPFESLAFTEALFDQNN